MKITDVVECYVAIRDFNTFGNCENNIKKGDVLKLIDIQKKEYFNLSIFETEDGEEVECEAGIIGEYLMRLVEDDNATVHGCSFCGNTKTNITMFNGKYHITCEECYCASPYIDGLSEAIKVWNGMMTKDSGRPNRSRSILDYDGEML